MLEAPLTGGLELLQQGIMTALVGDDEGGDLLREMEPLLRYDCPSHKNSIFDCLYIHLVYHYICMYMCLQFRREYPSSALFVLGCKVEAVNSCCRILQLLYFYKTVDGSNREGFCGEDPHQHVVCCSHCCKWRGKSEWLRDVSQAD